MLSERKLLETIFGRFSGYFEKILQKNHRNKLNTNYPGSTYFLNDRNRKLEKSFRTISRETFVILPLEKFVIPPFVIFPFVIHHSI